MTRLWAKILINSLILVLLPCSLTIAQDNNPYSIYDFSGGMNTVDNMAMVDKNQGYKYWNMILDDKIGSFSPRPGYRAITDSVAGYNNILSIYAHKWADGRGCFFQILDRDDTCYADLFISDVYKYTADDSIGSHLYPTETYWLSWLNNIYLFNGKNVVQVITGAPDNASMHDIIPHAPGELRVTPLATDGNIFGDVVYQTVWRHWSTGASFWGINNVGAGYVTKTVYSDSEKIYLDHFLPFAHYADSFDLLMTRTRPNRNDYGTDSLFVLDSFLNLMPADIDTFYYIDNQGADFDTNDYWQPIGYRASEVVMAMGSPHVMAKDDSSTVTYITTSDTVYDALRYVITYLDTITGAESDTSRGIITYPPDSDTLHSMRLWIPPILYANNVRVLYRNARENSEQLWMGYVCLDTIMLSTDTVYLDSLNIDSVNWYNDPLNVEVPLSLRFAGAVIHEDRMFAWDDHNVYMSGTGESGKWGVYDIVSFEMDDGDRVVRIESVEGGIVVYKTKSIYIIHTQDGFATYLSKKSSGIGMIAPKSLANYNGANLFLSGQGTTIETANIYQEHSLKRETFSKKIKNLVVRDVDDMVGGVGMSVDDIYLLSYPGTDSLFAFFHATGGWSVWGFDFSEAIFYDTLRRKDYTPFSQMVFIKDDDERVFVWNDGDTTDDGQDYYATYGKTFWTPTMEKLIPEKLHTLRTADVSDADTIACLITDEQGDTLATFNIDSLNYVSGYGFISTGDSNYTAHYLNLELRLPNRSNLLIDRLDFIIKSAGTDKPTMGE